MIKKKLFARAKKIRLIAMDIDGVLTGGELILLEDGQELKCWNVKDRIAFYYAKITGSGFRFAWITGRKSKQVEERAREIGIDALYQNRMDKGAALKDLCEKFSLAPDQVAYIGDDLIDLPVLVRVGLSACPKDAVPEVKRRVHLVSRHNGGAGVLREVVDLVLKGYGLWDTLVKKYNE